MVYLRHLMTNRIRQGLVVVSQCAGGNSSHKIQVGLSRLVGEGGTLSGYERDGISTVRFLYARVEESGGG